MIHLRAKDICERRAAGMAAATRARKTRFDDRPRAQLRAEAEEAMILAEGWEFLGRRNRR
jgi:hypothetical protein